MILNYFIFLLAVFFPFTSFASKPVEFIPLDSNHIEEMASDCFLTAKNNNIQFFSGLNGEIFFLTKSGNSIVKNKLTLDSQNNKKFNPSYSNSEFKLIFSNPNKAQNKVIITFYHNNTKSFSLLFKTQQSCL